MIRATIIKIRTGLRGAVSSASGRQEPEVPGSIFGLVPGVRSLTFASLSADSRRAVVSYCRKYVHLVLVNRLGGLSLPRNSMVRLTDRPDMA